TKKKFELALSITFRFNKEYYSISSSSIGIQDSLRKKYDEEISKEEIDYIVGKEVDRHKRILREKINS
ncbi:MAG: hypothetical protein AB8G22_25980, partial [Saprospiraceae bacterium]